MLSFPLGKEAFLPLILLWQLLTFLLVKEAILPQQLLTFPQVKEAVLLLILLWQLLTFLPVKEAIIPWQLLTFPQVKETVLPRQFLTFPLVKEAILPCLLLTFLLVKEAILPWQAIPPCHCSPSFQGSKQHPQATAHLSPGEGNSSPQTGQLSNQARSVRQGLRHSSRHRAPQTSLENSTISQEDNLTTTPQ